MSQTKTKYQLWMETIDRAKGNAAWDEYDETIKQAVLAYNVHLNGEKGYKALSWALIKAMVWTESGGPTNWSWKQRPMQIGNPGDPGLDALLGGKEGGELIVPPRMLAELTSQNARADPKKNIQAGIGYLLMRLASYKSVSVADPGDTIQSYKIQPKDSFSTIAARLGSTTMELEALNPGRAKLLRPGQEIKIRKAAIVKKIANFDTLDLKTVAKLYNTIDQRYAEKLAYCLKIIE